MEGKVHKLCDEGWIWDDIGLLAWDGGCICGMMKTLRLRKETVIRSSSDGRVQRQLVGGMDRNGDEWDGGSGLYEVGR